MVLRVMLVLALLLLLDSILVASLKQGNGTDVAGPGIRGATGSGGSTLPRTSAVATEGWWPHAPFLSSSAKRPPLEQPSGAPTVTSRMSQRSPRIVSPRARASF